MIIRYIEPFSKAWSRMIQALFKPFDISKWFVVGFTAFLAGLMDGHNGGGGGNSGRGGHFDADDFFRLPERAGEWIADNPGWFTLIVAGIIVIFLLIILFTWLSSRGKFMFLDNVVHDRALVKQPWREFKTLGDSLFLWRLAFGFVVFFIISIYLWFCYGMISDMYFDSAPEGSLIMTAIVMAILFVLLIIAIIYIAVFLDAFVVPIMYKRDQKTMVAWGHFLALFSQHRLYFILYGLFVLGLLILFIIAIIIGGFLTCCIGFLFLIIPYINSVVTLPIAWAFRAFSLEFLEQFGPDFKVYSDEQIVPEITPSEG